MSKVDSLLRKAVKYLSTVEFKRMQKMSAEEVLRLHNTPTSAKCPVTTRCPSCGLNTFVFVDAIKFEMCMVCGWRATHEQPGTSAPPFDKLAPVKLARQLDREHVIPVNIPVDDLMTPLKEGARIPTTSIDIVEHVNVK